MGAQTNPQAKAGANTDAKTDDWDDHWASYAGTNALNPAQTYRRKLVFELLALADAKAPVRLLDLGSGSGEFAADVLSVRPDAEILGLDLSDTGCAIAKRKVPNGHFFQQDFTKPIGVADRFGGWATHAVCSEVLEHLDNPAEMLRNVRALFAPGCKLVITVPAGPMSAFDKHIGHRQHFDADRLERTLRDAGLDVVDLRGAGFPFFNLYRLAVVARGEALIQRKSADGGNSLPLATRAAMHVFSVLFKMNTSKTRLGWQLAATASEPR
jgi:SAM-dependent methyltransferase